MSSPAAVPAPSTFGPQPAFPDAPYVTAAPVGGVAPALGVSGACGCPNVIVDEVRLPLGNNLMESCAPLPVGYQSVFDPTLNALAPVPSQVSPVLPVPAIATAPSAAPVPAETEPASIETSVKPAGQVSLGEVQGMYLPFDYGQVNYPGASFPYFQTQKGAAVSPGQSTVVDRVSHVLGNIRNDLMRTVGYRYGAAVTPSQAAALERLKQLRMPSTYRRMAGSVNATREAAYARLRPFWMQKMNQSVTGAQVHDESAFRRWADSLLNRFETDAIGMQVSPVTAIAPVAPLQPVALPWYRTFPGILLLVLLSVAAIGGVSYLLLRRYAKNRIENIKDMIKERIRSVRE